MQLIENLVKQLKSNKAAGADGLVAEHLLNSHPSLIVHLKLLFHMMITHCYVPNDFGLGIITPVPKENISSKQSCIDNYRPVTICSVLAKLFESLLVSLFSKYMDTSDLQFGFKPNTGCNSALFLLNRISNYYISRGSNIYIASLDATKACDRVNHYKLFSVMYKKDLPCIFIELISN